VYINSNPDPNRQQVYLNIGLTKGQKTVMEKAMLDSGATSSFVSNHFLKHHQFSPKPLATPIKVRNVDNTTNKSGYIRSYVELPIKIGDHISRERFLVTDIGDDRIMMGIDWLKKHNPGINWQTGEIQFTRCPENCQKKAENKEQNGTNPLNETTEYDEEDEEIDTVSYPIQEIRSARTDETDEYWEPISDEIGVRIAAKFTLSQEIAERTTLKEGEKTFEELVPEEFRNFADVFSKEASERMPIRKEYDHTIDIEPGKDPGYSKIYPVSPNEQYAVDEYLEENLAKGYIRPSHSNTAAPTFFVKKKDGKLRFVVDYRKLNAITKKDRYPLPLTTHLLDKLTNSKVFTTLDLRWGYNNIRLREGDETKAAFVTNRGLYEPLVMTFGLCNAPATFQRMMNDLFKDLINVCVVIYLDDIMIFSNNRKEHISQVREVLKRLRNNDLFCKPEKCKFFQEQLEYLGFIIGHNYLTMDKGKVTAVTEWPTPKKVKDIQSFLGFANFYRRFIQDFSGMAKPITKLLRKTQKWNWGEEQDQAFTAIKEAFTKSPILAMPNMNEPFIIECDASDFATGGILSQKGNDGRIHPIAFRSSAMNSAERNYEIFDKELLSIIRALEDWRHYLEGAEHPITILSDHQNLLYFSTARQLSRRQARWSIFLTRFNYKIEHRPGRLGGKPDRLSRRTDHKPEEGKDNSETMVLKPEVFKINATKRGHSTTVNDHPILKRIRQSKEIDESVATAIQTLHKLGPKKLRRGLEDWNNEDGLVLYRGKVYVPKDPDIRRDLTKLHHDSLESGHPGEAKTIELISRNYWWPGMTQYVKHYVSTCDTCHRKKHSTLKKRGPLSPIEPPEKPWDTVTNDFIIQLPKSKGYDGIWVVADILTKEAHFVPIKSDIDTETTLDLYLNNVWKLHGLPRKMISDRGTQFTSKLMRGLFKRLGIEGAYSTAYHPQTDGQTERINQDVEQYLRIFCDYRQNDWAGLLPMAEFAYNNRNHSSTGYSPFYAARGYHPHTIITQIVNSHIPKADELADRIQSVHKDIQSAIKLAQERMKYYYDQHRTDSEPLEEGSKVWLDAKNITTTAPSVKLADKKLGPFKIRKRLSPLTYELDLPKSIPIHPVFHISLLEPYKTTNIPNRIQPPPPPITIEGDEEYIVERILDGRLWRNQKQYLTKWDGYPDSDNSWEPVSNLQHAQNTINDFHDKHPDFVWTRSIRRKKP
jgi:hypothetical protein